MSLSDSAMTLIGKLNYMFDDIIDIGLAKGSKSLVQKN